MRTLGSACLMLASVFIITGCSGGRDRAIRMNHLKQIGLAYHTYYQDALKGPSKPDDLANHLENDQNILNLMRSGEVVVIWNISFPEVSRMAAGSAGTVLGYEKAVPEKGGFVVFVDGVVKDVTADEFKSLPKATPKTP